MKAVATGIAIGSTPWFIYGCNTGDWSYFFAAIIGTPLLIGGIYWLVK